MTLLALADILFVAVDVRFRGQADMTFAARMSAYNRKADIGCRFQYSDADL
jgi:hypothetical protein